VGFGPIELTLGEISIFENEDQDVVKISVVSPDLVRLNKIISDNLDHTDTFTYTPHVTLGYVKPGAGQKYVGRKDFAGTKVKIKEILFSGNDYRETVFPL
jgi:2'-5' RNA ligase